MVSPTDAASPPRLSLTFFALWLAYFYFVPYMPLTEGTSDANRMHFCRVDESVNPLPKPIFGLPCHDHCPDGTYATVDPENRQPEFLCS